MAATAARAVDLGRSFDDEMSDTPYAQDPGEEWTMARGLGSALLVVVSLVVMGALAAGCGGESAHCTVKGEHRCTDFPGVPDNVAMQEKLICIGQGGVYSSGACDRTGSLGGCYETISDRTGDYPTLVSTSWFYPSSSIKTSADVMTLCSDMMGVGVTSSFVAP